MFFEFFTILIAIAIAINNPSGAEISPTECVADWLVINRGIQYEQDEAAGRYCLEDWPAYIRDDDNDQEDRRRFDELVTNCVGEDRVQMSQDGRKRKVDVGLVRRENGEHRGDPFHVSRQLGYVLHTIKCVANYSAIYYENAKTEMVNPHKIRVIADTLPNIVHSGIDGFQELKECIERVEKPEESEKFLIGKMPTLLGTKKDQNLAKYLSIFSQNKDECIVIEDNQNNEGPDNSGMEINCISVQKLQQNSEIKRILQQHLIPTRENNDKIVAEMRCAVDFLVTKIMAKTRMDYFEKDHIIMRSVVKPKEPIEQDEEHWYQEKCAESVIRRNAMRKHGMAGMLEASYGTIYIEPRLRKEIDKLSVHLADFLATNYSSSGGLDIVRLTIKANVSMAKKIGASPFRIRINHEKIDLNYEISESPGCELYKYIRSMDGTKFKHLKHKTVAELVQMFDENQLFLSREFLNNYLDRTKGQERKMYSNLTCIADFMVIYEGKTPIGEDGKIVPYGYNTVERGQIGEELFEELAKCFGEDWVENEKGKIRLDTYDYLMWWGTDKYQVSEELERLLVNLRCVADYLMLTNKNVHIYSDLLNDMRVDEKTMPFNIRRENENSKEFDKMVECIKEPKKNYQILWHVLPSLIQLQEDGDEIRIQLKDPNNPFMDKILSHAYINEKISDIIRAKYKCIGNALIEKQNARTSLKRQPISRKIYRTVEIRILPENLLKETGCEQIFRNKNERKWKLEKKLNANNLNEIIAEQMVITDKQLLQKLAQQSKCLADCLAFHFWPKYVNEVTDRSLFFIATHTKTITIRFKSTNDLEFREKLERFLRNPETAKEFTKCVPKLAETPNDQRLNTFMAHLEQFDQDQLFLSKKFELFGCLADWLASKFGAKNIAKIDSNEIGLVNSLGLSKFKFQNEKSEEFYAELERKLPNAKNDEEYQELAKCVPELKLLKEEMMADASGQLLFHTMQDHLENLETIHLYLSKNCNLADCLPDYHPTEDMIDPENMCSICHDEFDEKNLAKQLPNCKHLYHANCIKPWLEKHNSCPYCRATIFS